MLSQSTSYDFTELLLFIYTVLSLTGQDIPDLLEQLDQLASSAADDKGKEQQEQSQASGDSAQSQGSQASGDSAQGQGNVKILKIPTAENNYHHYRNFPKFSDQIGLGKQCRPRSDYS